MTNYPTYQSPIRSFEALGISTDSIDPNQLKLEKKRLLLEIQISDSQTTTVGDKELIKNDVIELFDRLEGVTYLNYHTLIYQHPKLLHLLENSEVLPVKIEEHQKIRFDTQAKWDAFTEFVSPYLAEAIDKLLTKVIRKSNFHELEEIKGFFKLLTTHDSYHAFRKFNNFCETLGDRLEHLVYSQTTFPTTEVEYLRKPAFYTLANELSSTFTNLPNVIAHAVINFTVECERKTGRGKMLVEISDEARRLQCDAKMKSLIVSNRDAFYESREQKLGYEPTKIWRGLVTVIIVIVMIFRVTSRCDSDRDYSYSFDNQELLDRLRNNVQQANETVDFNEASLQHLQESIIKVTENTTYVDNYYLAQEDPGIISPFRSDTYGFRRTIFNETPSEMVMILATGSSLTSYFIPTKDSITFNADGDSDFFFYSGRKWDHSKMIQHLHQSPKTSQLHLIRSNGYFTSRTKKDEEFLKKFFTPSDSLTGNLVIKDEAEGYVLYQGGQRVNYSL